MRHLHTAATTGTHHAHHRPGACPALLRSRTGIDSHTLPRRCPRMSRERRRPRHTAIPLFLFLHRHTPCRGSRCHRRARLHGRRVRRWIQSCTLSRGSHHVLGEGFGSVSRQWGRIRSVRLARGRHGEEGRDHVSGIRERQCRARSMWGETG